MKKMSKKRLCEVFRIPYRRPLTRAERLKVDQVEILLDEMRDKCGMRDLAVFRAAGIEGPICGYLNNLHKTPQRVIVFCQRALAPDSTYRKVA